MKLSRIYSNSPSAFPSIKFNDGLNVILAEIHDPENLNKDTHNVGKTTLVRLVDFCLLMKRHPTFFLFKHADRFNDFVFYLELHLDDGTFLTIRRAVENPSKISFLSTSETFSEANSIPRSQWDHWELTFQRAKETLDGRLNFSAITKWDFRKPLGYALRLQDDYTDVFKLSGYRGKHSHWKPFLTDLIGLNGQLIEDSYRLQQKESELKSKIRNLKAILEDSSTSSDHLDGLILARSVEIEELENNMDHFDFKIPDKQISINLVDTIENDIAEYNEQRYNLRMALQTIDETLNATIKFDMKKIERIFSDAQIYLGDQLKRDYNDLLSFLTSISQERADILKEERVEHVQRLKEIDTQINNLNSERVHALKTLREAESLAKYRQYNKRLIEQKIDLENLKQKRDLMRDLSNHERDLEQTRQRRTEVTQIIEENIQHATHQDSRYRQIRVDFSKIIKNVLDRTAVLSSSLNSKQNIEFRADILDGSGNETSADDGNTYKKLLCVAFDLAVFASYLEESFVHFVFHEGIFETLDDRKKLCVLDEIRARSESGLQQIITVIDSDLPMNEDGSRLEFDDGEIIRRLHDKGQAGRLFNMPAW